MKVQYFLHFVRKFSLDIVKVLAADFGKNQNAAGRALRLKLSVG